MDERTVVDLRFSPRRSSQAMFFDFRELEANHKHVNYVQIKSLDIAVGFRSLSVTIESHLKLSHVLLNCR